MLDTDVGDDIDDAWAISLCACHPRIELLGITTVWGDTPLRAALARLLLERAGLKGVEVVAGSRDGLDRHVGPYRPNYADALGAREAKLREGRCDAVKFMSEVARNNPGLTLITIGPLTNAARFALEFPKEFSQISLLVMMCGHLIPGKGEPEYNAGADPRATQIVFSTKVPKVMVGLDVTLKCGLDEEDLKRLQAKGTPLAKALYQMTRLWQRKLRQPKQPPPRPIMHDPLAVFAAVEPKVLKFEDVRLKVDERGRMIRARGKPNVKVAVDVDVKRFKRMLLEVIG